MTLQFNRPRTAIALALGIALAAPAAFAQTQTAAQPQAPTATSAQAARPATGPAPTTAELQHFASAATEVMSIRQATEPKLAAAKTSDARTQLQKSAETKMEAAVQSHHLSVQRYQQIAAVVQTDSTVRTKVQQMMQKPAKS